jgi:hypothetical protein
VCVYQMPIPRCETSLKDSINLEYVPIMCLPNAKIPSSTLIYVCARVRSQGRPICSNGAEKISGSDEWGSPYVSVCRKQFSGHFSCSHMHTCVLDIRGWHINKLRLRTYMLGGSWRLKMSDTCIGWSACFEFGQAWGRKTGVQKT